MIKKNLLLPLILIFLTGSALGVFWAWQANQQTEEATPEENTEAVNESLSGLSQVISGSANFQFDMNSMPLGSTDAFTASLKGTLDFDTSNTENPLSLLSMDAVVETPQGTASYDDLAFLKAARQVYFSLNNLSLERPENTILGTTETYTPKWYEVSSTNNPLSILPYLSTLGVMGSEMEQGFDVPALQKALENTNLFDQVTQLGDETIDNVDTYHYSFSGLRSEQATTFVAQLSQSAAADETAISDLQNQLQQFNLTGEIWITKAEGVVKKIKLDVSPNTAESTGISIGVTINLTDLNRPVTIPLVQNAGDFDTFLTTLPSLQTDRSSSGETIDELTSSDKLPELP